jgi:signal transduction histidine kinase
MAQAGKILIVDDDPKTCNLLSLSLSPQGYEITSAHDAFQALERLEAERFNVVILDLMLPGPNGMEILRHIHEQQIDVEVIMITAYASLSSAIEALRLGAYDYITKPFQIDSVRSTVKRALEKQQLETRLAAIYDLSREMSLSSDADQVTETVLDIAERVLEFEICGLWLIDQEQDELYLHMARGIKVEAAPRLPLGDGNGILLAAVNSGDPVYVPRVKDNSGDAEVGSRSELAVPLKVKDRAVGVLEVQSAEVDAFSQSDLRLLSTLAAQAAVAIENAWLYEQAHQEIAERRRAEKEITRRNSELAALNEISQAITSTLDLQETLTLITDHITRLMGVAATSLLLYAEPTNDLWFAAGSGEDSDAMLGKRLAMGQGIAGWVAQHGKPALVPDVTKDNRWFSEFDKNSSFTTRSILCVPLQCKGQIIGAFEAINKKESEFDQEDLSLLSSLAARAATAIENARLFEQVRTGREQLQALSRRLVEVQEAERGHVARELHDETGQALSSLLLGLSLLEREADRPQAVIARATELETMVDEMLENLHRLAMNLRPAALDHLGLVAALEQYIEAFDRQHGVAAQFQTVGLNGERLPPATETALYRIVQEALTNVIRHAQASHVGVLLERRDDQVVTIIEDDGVGFDPDIAMQSSRLGLFGMRERAEMLGGKLVIESTAGKGTTVLVEIPYVHSYSNR